MSHLSQDQAVSLVALFGGEAHDLINHAASCHECEEQLAVLVALRTSLGDEVELPDGTVERILGAVPFEAEEVEGFHAEQAAPSRRAEVMDRLAGFVMAPMAAAVSAVFLGGLTAPAPIPMAPNLAMAALFAVTVGAWYGVRGVRGS